MTINRMLVLVAILAVAAISMYFYSSQRQPRRMRIYMVELPNQSESEATRAVEFFRQACPDMIVIRDASRADYSIATRWSNTGKWGVLANRKDETSILFREISPDAIETFRETCLAIRDDAQEVADFKAHEAPLPVGRYSLNSTPEHVLLLDTKTGAVWELKELGKLQAFERVSVEGLYDNNPLGVKP